MTALTILVWLTVMLLLAMRLIVLRRWSVQFQQVTDAQQLREQFAALRRTAVHLVHDNQLRGDSATFRLIYLVSSLLVRRTALYPRLARAVYEVARYGLRSESPELNQLRTETQAWTPDVREMWAEFAGCVKDMVRRYVWQIRLLDRLGGLSLATRGTQVQRGYIRVTRASTGLDVWQASEDSVRWSNQDPPTLLSRV